MYAAVAVCACRVLLLFVESAFAVGFGQLVHGLFYYAPGLRYVHAHVASAGCAEHLAVVEEQAGVVDIEVHNLLLRLKAEFVVVEEYEERCFRTYGGYLRAVLRKEREHVADILLYVSEHFV